MAKSRPGDILEVALPTGYAYVQWLAVNYQSCPALFRVFNGGFAEPIDDQERFAALSTQSYFFSDMRALLNDSRFTRVANVPIPDDVEMPPIRWRTVNKWLIRWADRKVYVDTLSDELMRAPEPIGLPAEGVYDQILAGRALEMSEIIDKVGNARRNAQQQPFAAVRFFIEFRSESDAISAKGELEADGYLVVRPDTSAPDDDGTDLPELQVKIAAACDADRDSLVDRSEAAILAIVARHGGELTGNEWGPE